MTDNDRSEKSDFPVPSESSVGGSIFLLFGKAILELLALPVHLIIFVARRSRTRREIREILEQNR